MFCLLRATSWCLPSGSVLHAVFCLPALHHLLCIQSRLSAFSAPTQSGPGKSPNSLLPAPESPEVGLLFGVLPQAPGEESGPPQRAHSLSGPDLVMVFTW